MEKPFLLINANIARPPVSPVGLEYVASSLSEAGFATEVIDLPFEDNWKEGIRRGLSTEPLAVGITVRNTDDCSFVTRKSFLPWIKEACSYIRGLTSAPIVLGGVGFSVFPQEVLKEVGADYGICGDGEAAAISLVSSIKRGEKSPPLISCPTDLSQFPPPIRNRVDNQRYEREGAMVGVETKRGCPEGCVYCADPVAKGRKIRLRPPEMVGAEIGNLVSQGVSWLHLCDSEFNIPPEHAEEICRVLIQSGLADRIHWYCYCAPVPFDEELARLMKRAGCAGINFGVDSLSDEQLARLGRRHSYGDVVRLVNFLNGEKLNFMFDLLLGAPGEREDTVRVTIERVKGLMVPLVGIALGVRIYPQTPLGEMALKGVFPKGLEPQGELNLAHPTFYLSPHLGKEPFALVQELIGDDNRFLFLAEPGQKGAYNYADDEVLCQLIKEGARGAYWDIIRKSLPSTSFDRF